MKYRHYVDIYIHIYACIYTYADNCKTVSLFIVGSNFCMVVGNNNCAFGSWVYPTGLAIRSIQLIKIGLQRIVNFANHAGSDQTFPTVSSLADRIMNGES